MLTIASCCFNNPFKTEKEKCINLTGVLLDIISGLALPIVGGLGVSGILALSPAAAYAMITIGAVQIAIFLLFALVSVLPVPNCLYGAGS